MRRAEKVLGPSAAADLGGAEAADEAMKAATKATSVARTVIAMKLVEVRRFTAEAALEAKSRLQETRGL